MAGALCVGARNRHSGRARVCGSSHGVCGSGLVASDFHHSFVAKFFAAVGHHHFGEIPSCLLFASCEVAARWTLPGGKA